MSCGGGGAGGKETKETVVNHVNQSDEKITSENFFKNKAPEGINYINNKPHNINLSTLNKPTNSKYRYIKVSLDEKGQNVIFLGKLSNINIDVMIPITQENLYYEVYGNSESTVKYQVSVKED